MTNAEPSHTEAFKERFDAIHSNVAKGHQGASPGKSVWP